MANVAFLKVFAGFETEYLLNLSFFLDYLMKLAKSVLMSVYLSAFLFLVAVNLSSATTHTITFAGTSFSPSSLSVTVGDTIVWSGTFGNHNIQSSSVPSGAATFAQSGGALSYIVSVAGSYSYLCTFHGSMTGTFTASAAASTTKGITLSVSNIDFGNKRVGTSTNMTSTVTSVGPDVALTISSSPLSVGTNFSNSPTSANRSINVNSTETETITFSPTARGIVYDTLTINSNATNTSDQTKKIFIRGAGINGVFSGATSIQFDKVRVGNSKQLTYTFTNSGDDTLFINTIGISGSGFNIVTGGSQTILPNGSGSVVVKFSPNIKQVYSGTLTITALNSVNVPAISLGGTGISPILGTATQNYDMGLAMVGVQLSGSLQITNSGDDTLHVTSVSIPTTQQGSKFTLGNGNGFILLPGASTNINFTYISLTESTDNATLIINSDDPGAASKQIPLLARSGLPKMSTSIVDTIDFGSVRIGSSAFANVTITNLGTYDLTVQVSQISPSQFTVAGAVSTVPPKGSAEAVLKFSPTAEGVITGMAIVQGNDETNRYDTIYMKGMGINSAVDIPTSLDFHQLNIGKTRDSVLTFRNMGTGGAKIFKYKLTDPDNGFILVDTSGHLLKAKDSITVKIRFAPTKEIAYGAVLDVITDDGAAPIRHITFAGTGINSKLSVDISAIDFGEVDSSASLTKKFRVTNNGSAQATITTATITGSPVFTLETLTPPIALAAGASKEISVTFAPLSKGTFDADVKITATEGSPILVSLHGKGKVPEITGSVRNSPVTIGLKMTLSPNPSNGSATVKISLAKPINMKLALFDVTGRLVMNYEDLLSGSLEYSLPLTLETLAGGEYYLRAIAGNMIVAETKVIIVR